MKAITIQQPWAWAVIHGGKDVENRTRIGTWRSVVGQRIAVHAGQRVSERGMADRRIGHALRDRGHLHAEPSPFSGALGNLLGAPVHLGAVIGSVLVEDVHPDAGCCAPWGEQSYVEAGGAKRIDIVHLRLADPQPCDPIPCRGALGLWTVPADITAELSALVVQEDQP